MTMLSGASDEYRAEKAPSGRVADNNELTTDAASEMPEVNTDGRAS